jgi:hypothetical protein
MVGVGKQRSKRRTTRRKRRHTAIIVEVEVVVGVIVSVVVIDTIVGQQRRLRRRHCRYRRRVIAQTSVNAGIEEGEKPLKRIETLIRKASSQQFQML